MLSYGVEEPCETDRRRSNQSPYLEPGCAIDKAVSKAFLTAYLLTADIEKAESITLVAIEAWNADSQSSDVLLQSILEATAWIGIEETCSHDHRSLAAPQGFPIELQNVLNLPELPRRCFVLRILMGLSLEGSSRLLNVSSYMLDEHVCCALGSLGALT